MRLAGGAGPVAGAQDRFARQGDVDALGVDDDVALGHRLPVADRLLQHADHPLVALDHRGGIAGVGGVHAREQVTEGVQHHVGLAEGREHLADVAQERGVRPDDEHAAALEDAAVRVEQVGGAVQRGDRLAGTRAALDDEDAGQVGADHPVLLGLDGRDDVGHPAGPRGRHRGDERGLAGQRAPVRLRQLVQVEHLVIHAGNRTPPGIDVAAADQSDRVTRRRRVERARGGGAPVNQLELVIVIPQADTADVEGISLFVVGAAETQAAFGQVKLGEPFGVLGRGNITFQPGLVGAAGPAAGAHAGQFPRAALPCLVKQAIQHRHVFLLRPHGGGVADGGHVSGVSRAGGFPGRRGSGVVGVSRAFRGLASASALPSAFLCAFLSGRLGIRLTNCHNN